MFLELNQIKKSFGSGENRVQVLKGIDLAVEKGEFCVLLGPSGSGKSTLLNILGGIDRADSGDILHRRRAYGRYEREGPDRSTAAAIWATFSRCTTSSLT